MSATVPLNVPRKAASQPAQEAGTPCMPFASSTDATVTLAGSAGAFALQAEQEWNFTPFGSSIPGLWQPVGSLMTTTGSYTLPGVRGSRVRLVLVSGNPTNIDATLTTSG